MVITVVSVISASLIGYVCFTVFVFSAVLQRLKAVDWTLTMEGVPGTHRGWFLSCCNWARRRRTHCVCRHRGGRNMTGTIDRRLGKYYGGRQWHPIYKDLTYALQSILTAALRCLSSPKSRGFFRGRDCCPWCPCRASLFHLHCLALPIPDCSISGRRTGHRRYYNHVRYHCSSLSPLTWRRPPSFEEPR